MTETMNPDTIKVALFEDNHHLRDTLSLLIGHTPGFALTGAWPDARNAVRRIREKLPDVVLMDIEMPGTNGIEATEEIRKNLPGVHVLIQTVFQDDENIFKAICAGASGYILKSTSPGEYLQAITEVHQGGSPMSSGIARRVLELFKLNLHAPQDERVHLTEKEKQVLQQLVDGKSYKMMASDMELSIETIKTHMKNIYAKLHVNSNTEAVAKVLKMRLLN